MVLELVQLLGGIVLLIFGGDWLLKASVGISLKLNIPKIIIGMSIVSFATSAPELIVSINAALDNHADISLGNVIGSNIANIGLVLGAVLLLTTIQVKKEFYQLDWPVIMGFSTLFFYFLHDGTIERWEGSILLLFLFAFLFYLIKYQAPKMAKEDLEDDNITPLATKFIVLYLILGGIGLWLGSDLLVNSAVSIAEKFGVEEKVIAVTMVAIGTSIPELTASIMAIVQKEKGISLGNLIGSNIFNIGAVIGITSLITPIKVTNESIIFFDSLWMLGFVFILLPFIFIPKRFKLGFWKGLILLLGYLSFIYFVI